MTKTILKFKTISEVRSWRKFLKNVALVPTMGNLHSGHLNLIREAKQNADHVIVSIFVNPIQFGVNEDFSTYPRTLENDLIAAKSAGAEAVFCPTNQELYPYGDQHIFVTPGQLETLYCGQTRPIHFRGVTTVVAKLFNIIQPDMAFFGKKDYQQLMVIRQMVEELNFNIKIQGVEIQREANLLALSSRNQYLSAEELVIAPQLHQTLLTTRDAIIAQPNDAQLIITEATTKLNQQHWDVDYFSLANQQNLQLASIDDKEVVLLIAAKLGTTRLIDNLEFTIP